MNAYQGPIQSKTYVSWLPFTNLKLESYTNTRDNGIIAQPSCYTNYFDIKLILEPLLTNAENF